MVLLLDRINLEDYFTELKVLKNIFTVLTILVKFVLLITTELMDTMILEEEINSIKQFEEILEKDKVKSFVERFINAKYENKCKFSIAWEGKCNRGTVEDSMYCKDHHNLECTNCSDQATHSCPEVFGPLACGAPLCDKCEHKFYETESDKIRKIHTKIK